MAEELQCHSEGASDAPEERLHARQVFNTLQVLWNNSLEQTRQLL